MLQQLFWTLEEKMHVDLCPRNEHAAFDLRLWRVASWEDTASWRTICAEIATSFLTTVFLPFAGGTRRAGKQAFFCDSWQVKGHMAEIHEWTCCIVATAPILSNLLRCCLVMGRQLSSGVLTCSTCSPVHFWSQCSSEQITYFFHQQALEGELCASLCEQGCRIAAQVALASALQVMMIFCCYKCIYILVRAQWRESEVVDCE